MLSKFFTSKNERVLKHYRKQVERINALERGMRALTDTQLKNQTVVLRTQLEHSGKIESVIDEAFATVRETARRVLGMRHYDVQLMGGLALVENKIPEMRTGEGKTLVAILGGYTLALWGKGIHVVTVNPYLAERDAELVRPVYEFLGMSIQALLPDQEPQAKRAAYLCDVTYGTNSEFGFDFLRDNLVHSVEEKVQRGHFAALIDEVDSILIDESRTPLIISGMSDQDQSLLPIVRTVALRLTRQRTPEAKGHFYVDEKEKRCTLSEQGLIEVEHLLEEIGILHPEEDKYQHKHLSVMAMLDMALKAEHLYLNDVDYLVKENEIIIIDTFTGRLQEGRRWSDGLHQAIEAKEGVEIHGESLTLSSITYQNYFRMYSNLSGMTGTADTEAMEFYEIYKLDTVVIPTNKPMIRKDELDAVFATAAEKMQAIADDIIESHTKGQPVLVGTTSVEQSEVLSALLDKKGIKHEVLNAKNHAKEAGIIAQAGRKGVVTIATNMAGRGTDILLGGNPEAMLKNGLALGLTFEDIQALCAKEHTEVLAAGGLRVIGTERHESRRVDNQLRGRAGRQGDPGNSRFYLSLDDGLLRIFGGDKLLSMVQRLGLKTGEAITSSWLSRSIENAQKRVEGQHYDIRKQLLEYDDVANAQRQAFYKQRDSLLLGTVGEWSSLREDTLREFIEQNIPQHSMLEQWDLPRLQKELHEDWDIVVDLQAAVDADTIEPSDIMRHVLEKANDTYNQHIGTLPENVQTQILASTLLRAMDMWWQRHLTDLDHLREGIHLRSYAQQDPKQAYKREAFGMFEEMVRALRGDAAKSMQLSRVIIESPHEGEPMEPEKLILDRLPA